LQLPGIPYATCAAFIARRDGERIEQEARDVTRSAQHRASSRLDGHARSICHIAACVAWLGLSGCATGRRDLPSPRARDAATLQAEAQGRPQDAEPLYQLALLHYASGEADAALQALHQSLQRDANYPPSLTLLAKLFHDTGRSREGLQYFEARKLDTLPEAVRLNVGLLYADAGNTVKARRILKGLAQGAYADAAAINLAYLDLVDEENVAAVRTLEQQAERFHGNPEVLNNLALARLRAGDVDGGTRLLRQVASQFPDFAPAQLNLALVLRNYLFDEDAATHAQAHFDALGSPHLGDAGIEAFLQDPVEDAAPRVPEPSALGAPKSAVPAAPKPAAPAATPEKKP
jgi:tetratricopeptide (TPR) repeat protein